MVLKALLRGWSHSDVALVTALTRSRVGQIALSLDIPKEHLQRRRHRIGG
jgi:hypothetical protein